MGIGGAFNLAFSIVSLIKTKQKYRNVKIDTELTKFIEDKNDHLYLINFKVENLGALDIKTWKLTLELPKDALAKNYQKNSSLFQHHSKNSPTDNNILICWIISDYRDRIHLNKTLDLSEHLEFKLLIDDKFLASHPDEAPKISYSFSYDNSTQPITGNIAITHHKQAHPERITI